MTVHELPVNLFSSQWHEPYGDSVSQFWLFCALCDFGNLPGLFWIFFGNSENYTMAQVFKPIWCAMCCKDCLLSVSNKISISAVAQYYGVVVYAVPCLQISGQSSALNVLILTFHLMLAFDCWVQKSTAHTHWLIVSMCNEISSGSSIKFNAFFTFVWL